MLAEEVRNLARLSAQAAQDTTRPIQQSVETAQADQTQLERVATGIRSIAEQSQRAKSLADDVRSGSQEQTLGLDQIAKTISQLEAVTQRAAKAAEESASAATRSSDQVSRITEISEDLTSIVGAGRG